MKIVQLLDFSPPFGGGLVTQLAHLGQTLTRAQHRLILVFPHPRSWWDQLEPHAQLHEMPAIRHPFRCRFPQKLGRLCREEQADLVHIHFSFALPVSLALAPLGSRLPLLYHWHNPPATLLPPEARPQRPSSPSAAVARLIPAPMAAAAARLADRRVIFRHLTVSREIGDLLVRHRWTSREKIHCLPNPAPRISASVGSVPVGSVSDGPPSGQGPSAPMAAAAPREHGASKRAHTLTIGMVASFRPQKDHATLLRAFAVLHRAHPDIRLVLVGDGPTRRAIEALAVRLGIAPHVEFTGALTDPAGITRDWDILALVSHYEGQGIVLLEAMAQGLPIVASAVGGISETVADEVDGLLVPPRDVSRLAGALTRLSADPALRARLGRAGIEKARGEFAPERWADRLLKIYEAAVTAPR